ncbi:hypothetical protein IW262DRAFT_607575 [Armillaria fumosa]|nr:hypothetical protein IW262DRAFT_607575 [Armillaria fumosa]
MAKKSKTQEKSTKQTKQFTAQSSSSEGIDLPNISPKRHLECRVLLENQILLIDKFLSAPECKAITQFIDSLPLELTPPKRRGEAACLFLISHCFCLRHQTRDLALFFPLGNHTPSTLTYVSISIPRLSTLALITTIPYEIQ